MPRVYKPVKPSSNKAADPVKETKTSKTAADKDKKEENGSK